MLDIQSDPLRWRSIKSALAQQLRNIAKDYLKTRQPAGLAEQSFRYAYKHNFKTNMGLFMATRQKHLLVVGIHEKSQWIHFESNRHTAWLDHRLFHQQNFKTSQQAKAWRPRQFEAQLGMAATTMQTKSKWLQAHVKDLGKHRLGQGAAARKKSSSTT